MRRPLIRSLAAAAMTVYAFVAFAQGSATPHGDVDVRTTILPGEGIVRPSLSGPVKRLPSGDITFNFPGVDIQAVAKAILGDTLGVAYTIDPAVHAQVTVRTPHPVPRQAVIAVFEQALSAANLVLVDRSGTYTILPSTTARAEAPTVDASDLGFGNETLRLKFVNVEEMRKLLDPLVPGAVTTTDPNQNTLVISGTSIQRKALRDLVTQFDVDWLKGMSFALFVPQRTDARLIAPELEKLLNGPGAPTAGLVRLIAMNSLNGILAITAQRQYLDDTRRFVEILDREGEGNERRLFVYRVQNGRAADLAKVLSSAFGGGGGGGSDADPQAPSIDDHTAPSAASLPPPSAFPGGQPNRASNGSPVNGGGLGSAGLGGPRAAEDNGQTPGVVATITSDDINNAVVVYSTPRNYAIISDALAKLDVPPLQVMIDASISEVTLDHTTQYGIQWSFAAGRNSAALTQGTNNIPLQNFPGLSYLYLGNNITATLNALATVADVKVLSAPKLMVMNNHTATIQVGAQVPIATGSALNVTTTSAIVNSIEYRDTGIILKVTPRVNSGGLVLLDIAQEVSEPENTSTSDITSPTIQQRKIATSVAVQDGETIALGGLIRDQVQKGRSTIPLLGEIPILGHLFGDTTGEHQRTELIVLLTPRVVRATIDARAVTQELMDKIHLGAPPPPTPPRHGSRVARP